MKAISCLVIVLFAATVALASRRIFPLISRERWNQIMPKMAAQLALRLQLQAGLIGSHLLPKTDDDEGECLKSLLDMVTGGSILNAILYSMKGLNDIGDYKSCVKSKDNRYILIMIKISDGTPSSSDLGICGPAKCRAEHYSKYLKSALMDFVKKEMEEEGVHPNGYFEFTDDAVRFIDVDEKNAELGTASPLTFILMILGIAAVIIGAVCTYLDYKLTEGKYSGNTGHPLIECCSLARNAKFLFYSKNTVDINLEVLNGVRVLSMFWVIFGHTFDYFNVSPISNIQDMPDYIKNNYWLQTFAAGTFSIDVFFFMSGFLCALTMTAQFKHIEGTSNLVKAVFVSYAHRYIRLLPLYLLAILITIAIVPYTFSEGPLAVFNEWQKDICIEKWWHNMLYIQNFTKIGEGCLIWSWYLANDMQFFLITPLLIILYHKNKSLCFYVIAGICALSVLAQILVVWHYDLSVSYFYPAKGELFEDYYVKPYCRINAYLLGIIMAWAYFSWKKPEEQESTINVLTKKWVENPTVKYVVMLIGIAITYAGVVFQYVFNHYSDSLTTWHNVVFIIVSRPLFVIGLLLVIYPAMLGKEKIISAILGAPFWNALAKLTYGAYLFHVIITIAEKSGEYHSSYFTIMRVIFFGIHVWVLSYLLSIVLTLFVELPVNRIDKVFLFPHRREAVSKLGDADSGDKKEKLLGGEKKTKSSDESPATAS